MGCSLSSSDSPSHSPDTAYIQKNDTAVPIPHTTQTISHSQVVVPLTLADTSTWLEAKLIQSNSLNSCSKLLQFECINSTALKQFSFAQHVRIRMLLASGKYLKHSYSPTQCDQANSFSLAVKRVENGRMSNYLHNLKPNDTIEFTGPLGAFTFEKCFARNNNCWILIAGGSGITPIYNCLLPVLQRSPADCKIILIYCNRSTAEIIFEKQLAELASQYPNKFVVYHLVKELELDKDPNDPAIEIKRDRHGEVIHKDLEQDENNKKPLIKYNSLIISQNSIEEYYKQQESNNKDEHKTVFMKIGVRLDKEFLKEILPIQLRNIDDQDYTASALLCGPDGLSSVAFSLLKLFGFRTSMDNSNKKHIYIF